MNNVWLMLLAICIGLVVVALPDNDKRLFSISKEHGPSLQDATGLLFIIVGYIGLVQKVWKRRSKILLYTQTKTYGFCLLILGLGAGLLIASVANDFRYWWVIGVAMLVLIQTLLFYKALK